MEHGEVVFRFLVPAEEDAVEAVESGMRVLHDTAASLLAGLALLRDLLAAGAQMQGEPDGLGQVTWLLIVIALVQA